MKTYAFVPVDTWFFRDGRPFNQGEMSQDDIASQFPPPVSTMVGGIRAALALQQGWPGRGDWSDAIKQVLGDRADLKGLSFVGPSVLYKGSPVFPAPSHLLARHKEYGWDAITLLKPGLPLNCDLGNAVRLPVAEKPVDGLKDVSEAWLTLKGMQQVIDGGAPDAEELIATADLWRHESRVGFKRDSGTKVVVDGALYSCCHVRLNDDVSVVVAVSGLPADWEPVSPSGFGGEGRSSWIEPVATAIPLPSPKIEMDVDGKIRFTVILNSPADLTVWPDIGKNVPGIPGQVVFGCIGRPQRVGGWDSAVGGGPLPLKPLIPPGSVWFMEADRDKAEVVKALHGTHIGERINWGFGRILIGTWKEGN